LEKPIAILGGGNGGHQMALDLTLRGYDINFCEHPDFKQSFKNTLETGEIESIGLIEEKAKIHKVTMNFKEAVEDVDLIYLVIPAIGHEKFFDSIIPHLRDGQLIVIWAGDAGALRLAKRLKKEVPEKKVHIAETNTLPYGTRIIGPSKVELFVKAKQMLFSTFPAKETQEMLGLVKETFPVLKPIDNILSVSFSNPNPTVHPPGTLLNVGRIQWSNGEFYLYREGITEAPARIIRKVYDETLTVANAYGFKMREFEDEKFRNPCSIMNDDFWAPFDKNGIVAHMRGPSNIYNRYITEDLPYGLVHRSQLGDLVNVPTTIIDSIIHLGAAICETDFWKGRTLDDLGIGGMKKERILDYIQNGY
jgi:opine dehydrogenase